MVCPRVRDRKMGKGEDNRFVQYSKLALNVKLTSFF